MISKKVELPVPVLNDPHWRVNLRPGEYRAELIPTLDKCFEIIEKTRVMLRGGDYPHLSNQDTKRLRGNNWIASWANFMMQREYWRFYQSGQFLHIFSLPEAIDPEWKQKIKSVMKCYLSLDGDINIDNVPGFISIENFIYKVTEIFEFAARLCQAQVYEGALNIDIRLIDIKNFVLSTDSRFWPAYYAATERELNHSWSIDSNHLVADSANHARNAVSWFFERFGWTPPSLELIRQVQENFLKMPL